jgi:hypothetical protein
MALAGPGRRTGAAPTSPTTSSAARTGTPQIPPRGNASESGIDLRTRKIDPKRKVVATEFNVANRRKPDITFAAVDVGVGREACLLASSMERPLPALCEPPGVLRERQDCGRGRST